MPGVAGSVFDVFDDVTKIGLVKTITISCFNAHISEELKKVRKGARIIISDRDTPIAEVGPYRTEPITLTIRHPRVSPFNAPRPTFKIDHDPLEYLLEDRQTRREPALIRPSSCGIS